jgi:hypothetical protein
MTEATMMFLNCPACLDQDSAVRCGLPAEVRDRFTMRSTGRPLDSVMIACPAGHHFSGPIEFLTPDNHVPGPAGASSRAGRDSLQRGHDGRDGDGGSALRDVPAAPEREARRPNNAPAYYLGRPAAVWITAMRPRRRRTAAHYLMEAVVGGGNSARDSCVLRHS